VPNRPEQILHVQVAEYLKLQYRDVIYRSDFAAGINMTIGQARLHKRLQSGRAYPDLFIAKPMGRTYHGCFIELKTPTAHNQPYLKDGTPGKAANIVEQRQVLEQLGELGYYARFAVGFDQARAIIDWYLGNNLRAPEPTPNFFITQKEASPYVF